MQLWHKIFLGILFFFMGWAVWLGFLNSATYTPFCFLMYLLLWGVWCAIILGIFNAVLLAGRTLRKINDWSKDKK